MSDTLTAHLAAVRRMMQSADIDHALLTTQPLDPAWLNNYDHQRVVNSFLFNYLKIQDKVGGKLFRDALRAWRELDTDDMTMLDVLHRLERLRIIDSVEAWDRLREIRNSLTHDYPEDIELQIANIRLALDAYLQLKQVVERLEQRLP